MRLRKTNKYAVTALAPGEGLVQVKLLVDEEAKISNTSGGRKESTLRSINVFSLRRQARGKKPNSRAHLSQMVTGAIQALESAFDIN